MPRILFEKLITDVYDEIDRRETEASKLKISTLNYELLIMFLFFKPSLDK